MSFKRNSDFGIPYGDDSPRTMGEVHNPSIGSAESGGSRKYLRSASISVATEPTSSGLSFILDLDKEEAIVHSQSLHDDIEKMFDNQPQFNLNDLLANGSECLPSERGQEVVEGPPIGIADKFAVDEKDIKSHRRSSFPHIHVPLKSLHSHSSKNFATLVDEEEKEKKKKRKKKKKKKEKPPKKSKSNIFPSKSASLSPAIPEVENEEYSESDESSLDDDEDDDDENTRLLDQVDAGAPPSPPRAKSPPTKSQGDNMLQIPKSDSGRSRQKSDPSIKHGLFYIGTNSPSGGGESTPNRNMSSTQVSESSSVVPLTGFSDSAPVVVILNDEKEPLISTSIKQASKNDEVHTINDVVEDRTETSVRFLLGEGEDEEAEEREMSEAEEEEPIWVPMEGGESRRSSDDKSHLAVSTHSSPKSVRSETSKRHRRHHKKPSEHYNVADLMRRQQRGSDVHLPDRLKRVPTETDEAMMLHSADLDEMASHRMEDFQGIRKHKIGRKKKHKTISSVVYIGRPGSKKRKAFKEPARKKYDHSPHEVFVELDELYTSENVAVEWREKARWIKFEEDVEEGAERWGKPHVASLSFHSLLELRKGLEHGSLLLDLEASDLQTIVTRVVDNMAIHEQIPSNLKGQVQRTLLTKHKFVDGTMVKTVLRRNVSSMNLLGLEARHQRDQLSLMKTLSSASFANIPSAANLQSLHNSTSPQEQNHQNNFQEMNNHNDFKARAHRSMSVPNAHHDIRHMSPDLLSPIRSNAKKKKKSGEPGKLEFVKVDVDNNMAKDDGGVHIGIVPTDTDAREGKTSDQRTLMRRIPTDAEACTVLVGCVDYLEKPAMAFVRLAERQVLDNLTEVPLPVRFIFVLLGPETSSMDYHEVGRSISTLMSNQHFHEIAYKAESRSEILHAINEFLNESIVLPPGDWDQKTLLPVMDMARKRAKIKRKKQKKQEEMDALLKIEEIQKIPMDPLRRTGHIFGGLINDVKRRYPHYVSDFTDALTPQCIMALIFIFFACLAPCIAFGGLLGEKTYGKMGVTETIISTALTNIVFGLFAGQPLILYGATGPVLVFEKHLYAFCEQSQIEFLPWRVWIGLWVFIITVVVIAVEGSFIVRYITRFTEEVFAILISLIFIFEVIHKLQELYEDHPLKSKEFYCDNYTREDSETQPLSNSSVYLNISTVSPLIRTLLSNVSVVLSNSTGYSVTTSHYDINDTHNSDAHGKGKYHGDKHGVYNEPNTALLSTILIFGTFLIAYFLRIFRNSKFLGRSRVGRFQLDGGINARRALGDFGIFTAIVLMVLFDYICDDAYTQKLDLPSSFGHTDRESRRWVVNPFGEKQKMELWLMIIAIVPAFLIFLLLFLEVQLTEMLMHKKEFKLKKGTGFHLDQFILGAMSFILALFGLPWMCAATVRTIAHVSALAVMSRTHAPGEKPKLLEVKDQRVTNIVMNLLIGTSLFWGPVLRAVPMAVLFGVFLYLGVSAISGVQLYKRIKLLFMPVKHHPGKSYVRRVPTFKMHLFTIVQIVLVAVLWVVKSTIAAIVFPLLVFLMVPFRLKLMPKFFTESELEVLDKEEEDSDDEEDEDPDFYQMAHLPV